MPGNEDFKVEVDLLVKKKKKELKIFSRHNELQELLTFVAFLY